MTIARTTIQVILANPSMTAKAQLAEIRKVHPGRSSEACVAWYKVHIKKELNGEPNKLGKEYKAMVRAPDAQLSMDL